MSKDKDHIGPLDQPEMKKNIFRTPEGYFEGLEERIKARLETENSELEQSEHLKTSVFEVPEGYFDILEDKLKAKAAEESSLLSKEEKLKIPPFETPEGYFEALENRLQSKLANEEAAETTKVIPIYQRNWFRMTVAAVLILGFFFLRRTDGEVLPGELTDELMLAYISESDTDMDLIASLDMEGFDTVIDQILEEETAGYDFDLGMNPELDYEFEYLEQ